MEALVQVYYHPVDRNLWTGRIDGTDESFLRWHQKIELIDLNDHPPLKGKIVFLGFVCDEGVHRNQGRVGAKEGPEALRKSISNLPVHFDGKTKLLDAGNVVCVGEDLEEAQQELANRVTQIVKAGGFPILLGGGHEITYGHFKGLQAAKSGKIGIINIDAHLDIRATADGRANSGTGFYQIAEEAKQNNSAFRYMAIGIQDISNTKALFDYADSMGTKIVKAENIHHEQIDPIIQEIFEFANAVDHVYLTIDMDVFSPAFAPGVSASSFQGIMPTHGFYRIFETIMNLDNLRSMDVAELNPLYDIDNRTARLAANLIFKAVQNLSSNA